MKTILFLSIFICVLALLAGYHAFGDPNMGKGKGAPEGWVAVIRPGRILYEMEGVSREVAMEAFRLAAHKLAVKTKFVERSLVS